MPDLVVLLSDFVEASHSADGGHSVPTRHVDPVSTGHGERCEGGDCATESCAGSAELQTGSWTCSRCWWLFVSL